MGLVDPVVEDPDLHPAARSCEAWAPEGRRADLVRAAVEGRAIGEARIDRGDSGEVGDARRLVGGDDEREAVDDDAVAPADEALRSGGGDARLDLPLRRR